MGPQMPLSNVCANKPRGLWIARHMLEGKRRRPCTAKPPDDVAHALRFGHARNDRESKCCDGIYKSPRHSRLCHTCWKRCCVSKRINKDDNKSAYTSTAPLPCQPGPPKVSEELRARPFARFPGKNGSGQFGRSALFWHSPIARWQSHSPRVQSRKRVCAASRYRKPPLTRPIACLKI